MAQARGEKLEQLVTAAELQALVDGRTDLDLPTGLSVPASLIAVHRDALQHKLADHVATIASLAHEGEQDQAQLRGDQANEKRLEQTVPLMAQQVAMKKKMFDDGWESDYQYLELQKDYVDRRQQLKTSKHKLDQDQASIANVGQKLKEADEKFRGDTLSALADAEQKAASLAQAEAKAADRVRLYQLRAPVDGLVQQLSVHSPGAMAMQGQPVLMVVPDDEGVAVEAAMQNRDAGFVHVGQDVQIKVETYPFTRYGTVPGVVDVVSGDAVENNAADPTQRPASQTDPANKQSGQDEQGSVYSVRVRPLRSTIFADGQDQPLTPGMAVTAEIKTGRRRVISYILDPVARYWGESLRER